MAELEAVVRSILVKVLDDSPNLRRGDLRYADHITYSLAREDVADRVVSELRGAGFLAFDVNGPVRDKHNFHAVSFTIKQMRTRLLTHIRGGGRDMEAECEWTESVATAFFCDLEASGWRLVRTTIPLPLGAHYPGPGFSGR